MNFLFQSNYVSYRQQYSYVLEFPAYEYLRELFIKELTFISEISRIEVLGYHKLKNDEKLYFEDVFQMVPIIFPTPEIYNTAIEIRKTYNLKLGDSIIAATAI